VIFLPPRAPRLRRGAPRNSQHLFDLFWNYVARSQDECVNLLPSPVEITLRSSKNKSKSFCSLGVPRRSLGALGGKKITSFRRPQQGELREILRWFKTCRSVYPCESVQSVKSVSNPGYRTVACSRFKRPEFAPSTPECAARVRPSLHEPLQRDHQ